MNTDTDSGAFLTAFGNCRHRRPCGRAPPTSQGQGAYQLQTSNAAQRPAYCL